MHQVKSIHTQVRSNVFETNSSSTHSICISKHPVSLTTLPKSVSFNLDEFGWECRRVRPADYLYTAIVCHSDNPDFYLGLIKSTLAQYGIKCRFGKVARNEWGVSNGYIDHGGEAVTMAQAIVSDPDRLIRYLFSPDTYVQTGNDNCSRCPDCEKCMVADGGYIKQPNGDFEYVPKPDDNDYEYFFKGN